MCLLGKTQHRTLVMERFKQNTPWCCCWQNMLVEVNKNYLFEAVAKV